MEMIWFRTINGYRRSRAIIEACEIMMKKGRNWVLSINESNFFGIVEELEAGGIKIFGDRCKGRTSILTNMAAGWNFGVLLMQS